MKYVLPPFLLALLLVGLSFQRLTIDEKVYAQAAARRENLLSCAPGGISATDTTAEGKFIHALPGWGKHHYRISSANDSTRFYFDQGLTMYYSYHLREAQASFREAARFDPDCAMAYWGQALSMGPQYNYSYSYVMKKNVPEVLARMNKVSSGSNAREQDLIKAMNSRYLPDTTDSRRKELNAAYASNMRNLIAKYPGDIEIKALFVDAVMLMHEWDFWNTDGTPKPWTQELVGYCKTILQADSVHPAGLHYYIHVTEASRNPQVALPNAERIKSVLPGVAHMVHMSSHEYERFGMYAYGVDANEQADSNIGNYYSVAKQVFAGRSRIPHYFAVQSYCALSGAMYTKGMPIARRCRQSVSPSAAQLLDQYLYMMPTLTLVRLGKWNEILADTIVPDTGWAYARILDDFARGMAYAHTGHIDLARQRLGSFRPRIQDPVLKPRYSPYMTSPSDGAAIAAHILDATISFMEHRYDLCVDALQKAIAIEDKMVYNEPKGWMIPARQYLGAYLLKMSKTQAAEKIYSEDLVWNPNNGWSNLGMYQCLVAQGQAAGADKYRTAYLQSFSRADEIPPASVY